MRSRKTTLKKGRSASRKTRRHSTQKGKTVPEIRRALSGIEEEVDRSISRSSSSSVDDLTKQFIRNWKATIGKDIPYKMAREYVELRMRASRLSRSRTQTRRTRGGNSETRPGLYGEYGNFLPYQSKFMDHWHSGISADCGKTPNPFPQGPQVPGSTTTGPQVIGPQAGGAFLSSLVGAPFTGLNTRFPPSAPPSVASDAASAINGQPILSSSPDAATIPTYKGLPTQTLPGSTVTRIA